jgi:CO dehydrogenase maturation factor
MVLSKIIALAGKGGVGKSTIATQLIRMLSRDGIVLAIDADPNSNLPEKLGMEIEGTIGKIRNEMVEDPDVIPKGMSKHEFTYQSVRRLVAESDRIDLLVMGRPEGAGCYCFTNNVLKECLSDLVPKYDFTVIDNEAGMEHLSRKVIPEADVLILVSDPTVIGIRTASRLTELSKEVGINVGKTILVINNASEISDTLMKEAGSAGFTETVVIPHDDMITKAAMETATLSIPDDSEFGKAVASLISVL